MGKIWSADDPKNYMPVQSGIGWEQFQYNYRVQYERKNGSGLAIVSQYGKERNRCDSYLDALGYVVDELHSAFQADDDELRYHVA